MTTGRFLSGAQLLHNSLTACPQPPHRLGARGSLDLSDFLVRDDVHEPQEHVARQLVQIFPRCEIRFRYAQVRA